jgi:hypothetical protein
MLGLFMAWLLAWTAASPPLDSSTAKGQMAFFAPAAPALVESARSPDRLVLAAVCIQAPAAPAEPRATGSRACCAEDGQTCVIQISPPGKGLAPDGRRSRGLPPKDDFSSAEPPRRDRPPRLTA